MESSTKKNRPNKRWMDVVEERLKPMKIKQCRRRADYRPGLKNIVRKNNSQRVVAPREEAEYIKSLLTN